MREHDVGSQVTCCQSNEATDDENEGKVQTNDSAKHDVIHMSRLDSLLKGKGGYSPVAGEEGEGSRRDSVVESDDGEVAYLPVFVASSFIVKLQSGVNKRII